MPDANLGLTAPVDLFILCVATSKEQMMTEIAVYVGQQRDGCTFELDPLSRDALLEAGAKPQTRSLFVAKDTRGSFEETWGELALQILQMLAGKNVENVAGFQDAIFLDPVDDNELLRITLHAEALTQHG